MSQGPESSYEISGIRLLVGDLSRIPKEFQKQTRPLLAKAGQSTLRASIINASAFSTRIPGSLRLSVSFSVRRPGITVRASRVIAPHARMFEGIVKDTWRHPVFGESPWVVQQSRPFMWPAVKSTREDLISGVESVLSGIAEKINNG